jgi:glycosyl hydrolase family 130 (putative beta-1,4-mannooligosaccharide phosphorylase)
MIYHGVRHTAAGCLYRLGLALFDLEKLDICIARGDSWIFGSEAPYEREGDVGNVTFPCGLTIGSDGGYSLSLLRRSRIRASLLLPAVFAAYCVGLPVTVISDPYGGAHQPFNKKENT